MKKKIQSDIRRKERGSCVIKVGKERFNFDKKEELIKYKYLCCESMKKKEWKKCNDLPYSYYGWSQEIKNRYVKYNLQQLEEFKRYLELCTRKKRVFQEGSNLIYAALVATIFAVIFDQIIVPITKNDTSLSDRRLDIIMLVLVLPLIIIYIIHSVFSPIKIDNLEKNMYCDYKAIIEEIIADKRNCSVSR